MRTLTRALAVVASVLGVGVGHARADPIDAAVESPLLVSEPGVPYPRAALDAGIRERVEVTLILELDAAGKVERASVVLPERPEFIEAALDAAKRLRFEPARRAGRAVPARIKFRLAFEPPPEPPRPSAAATPTTAPPQNQSRHPWNRSR
jgi:vitamin B12 transporter